MLRKYFSSILVLIVIGFSVETLAQPTSCIQTIFYKQYGNVCESWMDSSGATITPETFSLQIAMFQADMPQVSVHTIVQQYFHDYPSNARYSPSSVQKYIFLINAISSFQQGMAIAEGAVNQVGPMVAATSMSMPPGFVSAKTLGAIQEGGKLFKIIPKSPGVMQALRMAANTSDDVAVQLAKVAGAGRGFYLVIQNLTQGTKVVIEVGIRSATSGRFLLNLAKTVASKGQL